MLNHAISYIIKVTPYIIQMHYDCLPFDLHFFKVSGFGNIGKKKKKTKKKKKKRKQYIVLKRRDCLTYSFPKMFRVDQSAMFY
jgi:hypothetical protein